MISLNQFNVLVEIERGLYASAKEFLHMENEEFTRVTEWLLSEGLISSDLKNGYIVTDKGYKELEPFRVKRAIFMAAGFGSRMVPVTLTLPKPLVMVNGVRIIESLLDAVIEAGITEIYLIRGYQGEAFNMLLSKYPMIKFLENPDYNKANNISSAMIMKDLMENAYVFEADLVLYNKRIIRKYEYSTNYLGRQTDYTNDWCFKVKDGVIHELLTEGHDVWHMYGISYWSSEDACKMSSDIEKVYNGVDGHGKYWDEVSMRDCKDNYSISVKPVYEGDIIEIDTYEELKLVDRRYDV